MMANEDVIRSNTHPLPVLPPPRRAPEASFILDLQVPVSKYAAHCYKKLEKISRTGAKRGLRKPSFDEIEQAKVLKLLCVISVVTDKIYQ